MNTVHLRSEEFTERGKAQSGNPGDTAPFRAGYPAGDIRALGLNIVTVSNYIEEFINKNLVFEKEFDVSEGGRRPVLLDINPDSGLVIGVGVNLLNIVATVVDFKGRVSTRSSLERRHLGVKDIINCIIEVISTTLKKTKNSQSRIKGIGIGIAGIVNKKTAPCAGRKR